MIDLHCHILPGVDDGAATWEDAFTMARFYVGDGITHAFATPHCHKYVHLLKDVIVPRVEEMNRRLNEAQIPLKVLPGSEIQVTDSEEFRREFEAGLYCHLGNGREFTLLEFNWALAIYPPDAVSLVKWIRGQGMTPIIAHPERMNYFWEDPAKLPPLVDAGAWVQITVDSLLGNHGPGPKVAGEAMIKKYAAAVLATDAHNMARCSGLASGFSWAREHLGVERAKDLQARAELVLASATA